MRITTKQKFRLIKKKVKKALKKSTNFVKIEKVTRIFIAITTTTEKTLTKYTARIKRKTNLAKILTFLDKEER